MWAAPPLCKGALGEEMKTSPHVVQCSQSSAKPDGATMPCQSGPGDYSAPAAGSGGPHCVAAALRRDGRVADGARLESVYTGNRIVGSNPTPSATTPFAHG